MIDTALIPIAGLGTRMRPLTRAVPKAMFPLVTAGGQARPVIHCIVAEATAAGIERIGVIVSAGQAELVGRYFTAVDEADGSCLAERIEYIAQPTPAGFGDAVARGRDFVGDEPFLLMLGDYVYTAEPGGPACADQVVTAFAVRGGAAMVGMQPIGPDELARCGTARGEPVDGDVYRCTRLIEKPDLETARAELVTPGLPPDRFLAHCGIYAFAPLVFDCLDELMAAGRPEGEEVQFADAQGMLLERNPDDYYLVRVRGRAYDTGSPEGYVEAQAAFAAAPHA